MGHCDGELVLRWKRRSAMMKGSFNLEIKKGKVVNLMESGNSLPILPLRLQSVRSFAGNTNDRMYIVSLLD